MFGKSMLASICIVGALIIALFPAGVVGAGSSESGFHISQWTGETWEEIYQHQFQVQYSTEAFTVDVVDGEVALRLVQVGTPFADVDQISLMVDGKELTPEYARYTESGQSIVEDILGFDHNVVIAHEQEIEVSWDVPAGYGSVTVYLTANEYGHGLPLRFPETGYATYEVGSNIGSITVDGLIPEADGTVPLYCPYWQPSSGHPDGYTYIYVCDDEEYVYFSLDVTGDNTNEYGEDWAEISIRQPDGSKKVFRIDDYDNTWGTSGFGLTSKVSYKHQTYEFAIPKSIIGNENIEFNLAYYGTMAMDYYINADIYLDIQIDGDSSEGQVFQVGDTLNITGLVSSEAAIHVSSGDGVADVYSELSVAGPSGSDSDSCSDHEEGTGYLDAQIYYLNEWTSLSYPLTDVGLHTITLYSEAHLEGQTEHEGYVDESDDSEISLDFYVSSSGCASIANGSFEAGNYTSWALMEYYDEEEEHYVDPYCGTFGIAADGETISYGNSTYDFYDAMNVTQWSENLPITYNATDGGYLAYILTNCEQTFRMYQDITLDGSAENLTWDMMYENDAYEFDPFWQYLAVNVRDTDDNILETLFKTTNSTDPHSINMTGFSGDISAYGNQTIRLDIEQRVYWGYFDSAFDNFAIVGGTNALVNGSFETQDYTGWTLMEYVEEEEPDGSECGTFGIAANDETISYGDSTYDFHDGLNVTQWSANLPITYNATDGGYLAYILTNCEQTHRMYQDITLDEFAENLTWDMMYVTDYPEFDPVQQYIAVNIRDTDDNILETLFKTTHGVDPYSINMTSFSGDISAYGNQTIRLDIEERNYWSRLDSAFDNFAVVGGTNLVDNGSFETQDYTGWTLMEYYEPLVSPEDGTFGIAEDGQTINYGESTWDFHDGLNVTQLSEGLPITYHATDGDYLAYILVNGPETLRMYQDITLCPNATMLTWDMQYTNHDDNFDPYYQYLAVNIRNPSDDSIIETLFKTTQGVDPVSIPMTRFSGNISAYAGTTVRLDITQSQYNYYFDSAFDNFAINAPILGRLFMVDCDSSQIYELDPATGAVVNNFSTPVPAGECDGLAYGNGRMFYVCCNATIYEIDPSDGEILHQFTGLEEASLDALGFSGDRLYALEYSDYPTIHVLDPDSGANITILEPGIPLIGGLTFAGARGSLFVSNDGGGETPSFGMTDKGFEFGNFTGWNVYTPSGGSTSVVTSWDSPNSTNYTAASGDWFALLQNGAQNESTYISQNFTIDAGDIIQGWAFFSTGEDYGDEPYIDECSVDIMDGATLVDRVFYADTYDPNWPDTPWTYWSWEAPSAGNYTLLARVVNIGDGDVPSYVGLDVAEEEPNTIYEIDAETGEVLNSFSAPAGSGGGLLGLGFSSSRNTLFLGFEEYDMIYEVDPDTGYVINSFAGPEGAAISALAADECGALIPPTLEADFHASNTTVCANVTIDFFDDSTGTYDSWYWEFGDGSNSTESNPSHNYTSVGNYTVSLTISNGCGSDTETKIDYIEVLPLSEANTVTVEAEADGSPLVVPIDWSWDLNSSTDTTSFAVEDIPDGTELSLTAPATHTQNYTFYVFNHWSVGATDYDPNDVDITFEVNENLTAIAHYIPVITVDKTLDRCDDGSISNPFDPNALPLKTSIYFGMIITVEGLADGIDNVRVEDGIGADLSPVYTSGPGVQTPEIMGKGKKGATKCVWILGSINDGETDTLYITAYTGTNPKGKQQYASPGEHTLNSGPKVFFTYDGEDYMLQGPSITVNVVK
jgi:PKD repeat protein